MREMKLVLTATELLLLHELTKVRLYGRVYISAELWKAAVEGSVVLKQTSADTVDAMALQTLSTEAAGGIRLNIHSRDTRKETREASRNG